MSDTFLRRVATGVIWSYAALLGGRLIVFAGLALTARVLSPAEFGEFAMAMSVVSFLEVVRGFGLQRSLIYFGGKSGSTGVLGTGFVLSLLMGTALAALLIGSSGALADYFGVAVVRDYLVALALYFVIGAIGLVPDVVLRERLDFRQRFIPEMAAPIVRYALAIGFAMAGYGAWSLVIGQTGGAIVGVALTFLASRWRPSLDLEAGTARQLLGFGWQMNIVDLCSAITLNVDYLLIGRFLGSDELGAYSLAFRLPDTTIVAVAFAVAQLLLPAYVKLGADAGAMRQGFMETTRYLAMVLLPAAAGMIVLAPWIVEAVFGSQWTASAPLVQLLAISALLRALAFAPGAIFVASGRPGLSVLSELVGSGVTVALIALAAQHSAVAVATAQVLAAIVYGAFKLSLLRPVINLGWSAMVAPIWGSACATAVMVAALLLLGLVRGPWDVSSYAALAVLLGAGVYAVTIWNIDGPSIRRAAQLVRGHGQPAEAALA